MNLVGPTDPTLSSVTPSLVDTDSTTSLTLAGTHLGATQGTGKLTFQRAGSAPVSVTLVTSWSDGQIVCPVPANVTLSPGSVDVTATPGTGAKTNSLTLKVDSVGPLLHGPRLGLITQQGATISWDTWDPETGEVRWGPTIAYGSSLKEPAATAKHRRTLGGLVMGSTYHYAVVAGGQTHLRPLPSSRIPDFTELEDVDPAVHHADAGRGWLGRLKTHRTQTGEPARFTEWKPFRNKPARARTQLGNTPETR